MITEEIQELLSYMFGDYACDKGPWFRDVDYDEETNRLSITAVDPDHPESDEEKITVEESKILTELDAWADFILNAPNPNRFSAQTAQVIKKRDWDDFDYDIVIADSIVQFIAFGEIRYS